MKRRTLARKLLLALLGGLLLAPYIGWAAESYQIGAIFPLSGPNAVYGRIFSGAVNLAVKDVNDRRELPAPLRVLYEDSRALPQPAIVAMNKLVNIERVPMVLSAFSVVTKAVTPIAARRKVMVINGGAVSPELAGLSPYLLNDIPLVDDELHVLIPYVTAELKLFRIAFMYVDDPFGQGALAAARRECARHGCSAIALSIDPRASDFRAEVAKVRDARPDAVYIASYGQQQNLIMKQLRDGRVTQQILGYSGMDVPDTLRLPEAQGVIFTGEHVDFSSSDPVTRTFVQSVETTYHAKPTFYQANYYNAVLVFVRSTQWLAAHHLKLSGENLLRAARSIGRFQVAGTTLSFEPDGTVHEPIGINRLRDGKAELIKVVR